MHLVQAPGTGTGDWMRRCLPSFTITIDGTCDVSIQATGAVANVQVPAIWSTYQDPGTTQPYTPQPCPTAPGATVSGASDMMNAIKVALSKYVYSGGIALQLDSFDWETDGVAKIETRASASFTASGVLVYAVTDVRRGRREGRGCRRARCCSHCRWRRAAAEAVRCSGACRGANALASPRLYFAAPADNWGPCNRHRRLGSAAARLRGHQLSHSHRQC
jgi:hypothetical protein